MEVRQDEMTNEVWEEWKGLVNGQECAECGLALTIRTVPERATMVVGCSNPEHSGFRQRTTATEEYRRGAEVYPDIRDNIEAKMIEKAGFSRAMNLLALRFPSAIHDMAGAALFINDCMRLGLDPLIQPAEAVPVTFRSKDKVTVAMVVTEDGALSMAARGCPEEYDGAPATMPLLDYLMREHRQRSYEDLMPMAQRTAEELCGDKEAYVWVALGKRRSATETNPVYGYFTKAEQKKAKENRLPAGTQPGNQARVRAIKRWVRENFPEARQKMLEYTAEINRRSEGAKEALEIIDAEYSILSTPSTPLISPTGQKAAANPIKTRTTKQPGNKVGESAKRKPADQKPATAQSGADEATLFPEEKGAENTKNCEVPASRQVADQIKPDDIPDGFALEKIANEVWGLQPKQLWDELNYPSVHRFQDAGVESPWDCFLKIKAVR